MLICLLVVLLASLPYMQAAQHIAFASFDNQNFASLRVEKPDPSWYAGQDATLSTTDNSILLTPDPKIFGQTSTLVNIGKIVYQDRIKFKSPTVGMASFSTSFTFKITTTRKYPDNGSGMVFFIADDVKVPEKSYGRYFGMVSPAAINAQRFFAIEFDTHQSVNLMDVSASHIGIDINSLHSRAFANSSPSSEYYPELFLYSNYTFTTWVEYNSTTHLTQVWMTNSMTSRRPSRACVNFTYDLSTIFNNTMFVGFSATNNVSEDGMEGHALFSWNFTTYYPDQHPRVLKSVLIDGGVVIIVALVCCALLFIWKRKRMSSFGHPGSTHAHSGSIEISVDHLPSVPQFTLKKLRKATNNFEETNLIGEGGFSFVYKGVLEDGHIVAVKKLKDSFKKDRRRAEFLTELKVISKLQHRNLLKLRGWCYENEEALLVYDYMSNGSLESYLYGDHEGRVLPINASIRILAGVASALHYLHENLDQCVLHRDVKPANVLLTDDFQPLLGDFGVACLISHSQADAITLTAVGTTGYMAPEVAFLNQFSKKADVYGYGILALEVACRRRAIDRSQLNPSDVRLVEWVWRLHLSDKLTEALDASMVLGMSQLQKEQWRRVLILALMCCNPSAEARPDMSQVCQTLEGDNVLLREPLPRSRDWVPPLDESWPSASNSSISAR